MNLNPMEQFAIKPIIPLHIGGYDVSFTNQSLLMVVVLAAAALFLTLAVKPGRLVPTRSCGRLVPSSAQHHRRDPRRDPRHGRRQMADTIPFPEEKRDPAQIAAVVNELFVRCESGTGWPLHLRYRALPTVNLGFPRTGNLWGSWEVEKNGGIPH